MVPEWGLLGRCEQVTLTNVPQHGACTRQADQLLHLAPEQVGGVAGAPLANLTTPLGARLLKILKSIVN